MKKRLCYIFVSIFSIYMLFASDMQKTVLPYLQNFYILLEEEEKTEKPTWFLAEILFYVSFVRNSDDLSSLIQEAGISEINDITEMSRTVLRRFYEQAALQDEIEFNPIVLMQNSLPDFKKTAVEEFLGVPSGTLSREYRFIPSQNTILPDEERIRRSVITSYYTADLLFSEFLSAENKNDSVIRTLLDPGALYVIFSDEKYTEFYDEISVQYSALKDQLCKLLGISSYSEAANVWGQNPWNFAQLSGGTVILPEDFSALQGAVQSGSFGIVLLDEKNTPYVKVHADMTFSELVYLTFGYMNHIRFLSIESGFPLALAYTPDIASFADYAIEHPVILTTLSTQELVYVAQSLENALYIAQAYCSRVNTLLRRAIPL